MVASMLNLKMERIKSLSLKFDETQQKLETTISTMKAKRDEVLGAWEGEAAETFQERFSCFLSDTEAYTRLLKNTITSFDTVYKQLMGAVESVDKMSSSFGSQSYNSNIEEARIMYEENSFLAILNGSDRIEDTYERQVNTTESIYHESFQLADNGLSNELLSLKKAFSQSQENIGTYLFHARDYQNRISNIRNTIETLFSIDSKEYVGKGIDFSVSYHENIATLEMFMKVFNFDDMSITEEGFKCLEGLLVRINNDEIEEDELLAFLEVIGSISETDLFKLLDTGEDAVEGFAKIYAQFFFYVNQMIPTVTPTANGFAIFTNNIGYNISGGPRRMKLETLIKDYPKIFEKFSTLEKLNKLSKVLEKVSIALIVAETGFKIVGDVAYDVKNEMNLVVIGGNVVLNIAGGFAKYGAMEVVAAGGAAVTGMVIVGIASAPAWVITSAIVICVGVTVFVGWAVCEVIDFIVDEVQDFLRDCNEFINDAVDGVGNFMSDVVDGISNFFGDIGKGVGDFFGI